MKAKAMEIRWHDISPIYSVDFQSVQPGEYASPAAAPAVQSVQGGAGEGLAREEASGGEGKEGAKEEEKCWRLATGGADKLIRLWLVHPRPVAPSTTAQVPSTSKLPAPALPFDDSPKIEYLTTLSQHDSIVNVVRFSPTEMKLASAGDDGNIILWIPGPHTTGNFADANLAAEREFERESWRVAKVMRLTGDLKDIYDLAWSPDGKHILSGSLDQTAKIWDTITGNLIHSIADHSNYVQGVAWDPLNQYIATQSSDRSMHTYSLATSQTSGLTTHLVGKTSRLEVKTGSAKASGKKVADPSVVKAIADVPIQDKGKSKVTASTKEEDTPAVDSTSSTPRPTLASFPSTSTSTSALDDTEETSMDPPAFRPSSRRSSASSHASPQVLPHTSRNLRSPSPAPLPAIKIQPSPTARAAAGLDVKSEFRLYGDVNSTAYFRRLCWSPDGALLLTPAGIFEEPTPVVVKKPVEETNGEEGSTKKKRKQANPTASTSKAKPTVYIYTRSNVSRPPLFHLPGHQSTSIAIRFSPLLLDLRKLDTPAGKSVAVELSTDAVAVELPKVDAKGTDKDAPREKGIFDLPYRMVYAVATLDTIYIYDTQQAGPICTFGHLASSQFTDLSWTSDGETLIVSSHDGYCSLIAFDPQELGTPYLPLSHPAPTLLMPALSNPISIAGEKRPAEEGEKQVVMLVKKKKKVELTFVGPIGGGV